MDFSPNLLSLILFPFLIFFFSFLCCLGSCLCLLSFSLFQGVQPLVGKALGHSFRTGIYAYLGFVLSVLSLSCAKVSSFSRFSILLKPQSFWRGAEPMQRKFRGLKRSRISAATQPARCRLAEGGPQMSLPNDATSADDIRQVSQLAFPHDSKGVHFH